MTGSGRLHKCYKLCVVLPVRVFVGARLLVRDGKGEREAGSELEPRCALQMQTWTSLVQFV